MQTLLRRWVWKKDRDEIDTHYLQVLKWLSSVRRECVVRRVSSNWLSEKTEHDREKSTTTLFFLAFLSVVFARHRWDIQAFSPSLSLPHCWLFDFFYPSKNELTCHIHTYLQQQISNQMSAKSHRRRLFIRPGEDSPFNQHISQVRCLSKVSTKTGREWRRVRTILLAKERNVNESPYVYSSLLGLEWWKSEENKFS